MKHLYLLFVCLTSLAPLTAQQLPTFSFFRENAGLFNPGGLSQDHVIGDYPMSINMGYREQWAAFKQLDAPGAAKRWPRTFFLNWEWAPLSSNAFGGMNIMSDQITEFELVHLAGRFGYKIKLDPYGDRTLNIGISSAYVQYRRDRARTLPELASDKVSYVDFSFGAMYYHEDKFYLGASVPQTFQVIPGQNRQDSIGRVEHYYLMGGFQVETFLFGSDASYFDIAGMIRYVPNTSKPALDINARLQLGNLLWIGAGSTLAHTLRSEIGFVLNNKTVQISDGQFRVGFAYSLGLSPFSRTFGNTWELQLGGAF